MYNGAQWIDGCMHALLRQTWVRRHRLDVVDSHGEAHPGDAAAVITDGADAATAVDATTADDATAAVDAVVHSNDGLIELSAYDDGSTDESWHRLLTWWAPYLRQRGWLVTLGRGTPPARGCGHAKNRAVAQSSGEWLCFQDVDDLSLPERLERQLAACRRRSGCLVGCQVRRQPEGSTARYIRWANGMSEAQLVLHRFRECTLLMPTWFMARATFEASGRFREEKCEDLLFLQAHVLRGGSLHRVDVVLVEYRYHAAAATHAIPRQTLLHHRVSAIEVAILEHWPHFSIWGAGRDGRDFFKALQPRLRQRVVAFCDVDEKKVRWRRWLRPTMLT